MTEGVQGRSGLTTERDALDLAISKRTGELSGALNGPSLDPTLVETVRLFHALHQSARPDRAFGDQLWEELMNQGTLAGSLRPSAIAPPAFVGRSQSNPRRDIRPEVTDTRRLWRHGPTWAMAQLATVALLLITVIGIYRTAWDDLPSGNGPHGVIVPATEEGCRAREGTPASAASPVALDIQMPNSATSTYPPVSFLWESAGVPGEEILFGKLAIGPHCQIWAVDQLANRFLIFDSDGNLLDTWGSGGDGEGQFDFGGPDFFAWGGSIAFALDGGFYVSDVMHSRIQQFDTDRRFVRAWSITSDAAVESDVPTWIGVGLDGNVYVVVDTNDDIIQVYSSDGVFIRSFGSNSVGPGQLSGSGAIAFDPAGNLWFLDQDLRRLVQFSPTGEPMAMLEPPEIGRTPLGLAIDAAGRFYVVSHADNIISVIDPLGSLLYSWGGLGMRGGKFLNPTSIALDGDGGVYISEFGNPRMQKFQIQPGVLATAEKCRSTDSAANSMAPRVQLATPDAMNDIISFIWASTGAPEVRELISHIAIDAKCRLWVMDHNANRFLILDLDGNLIETWGSPGSGEGQFNFGNAEYYFMNGIAFAPDGGFYISDAVNLRVQQFAADRQFIREWRLNGDDEAESQIPSWIAVGPDGNVYVTVYAVDGKIQVFTPDGKFIRKFGNAVPGPGQLSESGSIAFDPAGNLWALDPGSRRLVQFSPTGEPLNVLDLKEVSTTSSALAIDDTGRFYVVDSHDHRVLVFDSAGTFLYSWGELGFAEGKFVNPFSIALDGNGGVYIAEGGNPRIQKFQFQIHP